MRVTCIIQARAGGTRLPGKVLMDVAGKPLLQRVVERVKAAKEVDGLVVAMPDTPENAPVAELCSRHRWDFYRHPGPEADVLRRYRCAAEVYGIETVMRVTADCPLLDPGVLNGLVRLFRRGDADYAANNLHPSFPHGLDAEVFSLDALRRADRTTTRADWREHLDCFRAQPEVYRMANLECPEDLSHYRLTVDYEEDLELVRTVYAAIDAGRLSNTRDVLWFLDHRPDLQELMKTTRLRWKYATT
jgi:spore coat polysaccharide biosynthesis protein SpsF